MCKNRAGCPEEALWAAGAAVPNVLCRAVVAAPEYMIYRFGLKRKHAELVAADDYISSIFEEHCTLETDGHWLGCLSDEHYVRALLLHVFTAMTLCACPALCTAIRQQPIIYPPMPAHIPMSDTVAFLLVQLVV